MAELVGRIDSKYKYSPFRCWLKQILNTKKINSSAFGTFGCTKCGIHAICVSVDELFIDAGDQCTKYHSDVGYLPRELPRRC
jgi:hypothetical protein